MKFSYLLMVDNRPSICAYRANIVTTNYQIKCFYVRIFKARGYTVADQNEHEKRTPPYPQSPEHFVCLPNTGHIGYIWLGR